MDDYVGRTSVALTPIFNQAQNTIRAGVPAIQNLYAALISGLEGSAAGQGQQLAASAAQRGVGGGVMQGDLQAQLGQALLASRGQLGVNRAQGVAGLRGQQTEAETQRLSSTYGMAQQSQGAAVDRETARLQRQARQEQMQQEEAESGLEIQILQRQQEEQRRQEAEAAARRSSGGASVTSSVNQLYDAFSQIAGADGYVNPNDYNRAREAWQQMGLPLKNFDSSFKKFVNPAHQRNARSDLLRYAGQSTSGR